MKPNESNPWRTIASREIYQNAWIRLREDQVVRPDGQPGLYGVVEMTPAVGVVALSSDHRVYLVGQYRYPTDCYSWEIIAGYSAPGEDPLAAAQRELREEVGLSAERWTSLGDCQISNSATDQVGQIFLAQGLTQGRHRAGRHRGATGQDDAARRSNRVSQRKRHHSGVQRSRPLSGLESREARVTSPVGR